MKSPRGWWPAFESGKSLAGWLALSPGQRESLLQTLRSARVVLPSAKEELDAAADALECLVELSTLVGFVRHRLGCERCGCREELEAHQKIKQLLGKKEG